MSEQDERRRQELLKRIENDFQFHPATGTTGELHAWVRGQCLTLARELAHMLPVCREQSLALTSLEEVMMWSNAAIARYMAPVEGQA